ncbi:hypothetical protein THZB04_30177 [Vibrio owensii]|nr:hypothetical protein THZB04_30177 [Vibrio owensii]
MNKLGMTWSLSVSLSSVCFHMVRTFNTELTVSNTIIKDSGRTIFCLMERLLNMNRYLCFIVQITIEFIKQKAYKIAYTVQRPLIIFVFSTNILDSTNN